ncbi:DUF308 domain-containing protein [uncultured Bacteroides sp.]|uniref:HdeD family acid-resistance protein n=1 Tax=uncultured Bacteroides sp. TaxID=162156 RepID=UPI002AA850AA|nr:DUF308 domain-containing protein [uncultured Bacteroides sp.]
MKAINSSLIRIVFALIIGLVLIIWPDAAADYIVITVGILFIIPGAIVTIGYFARKSVPETSRRFPIEGVGSFLLGLWLVIMPGFFANVLMFLLGFILIVGGIQQITSLVIARQWITVSASFYIIPILILLAGISVLFYPTQTRNTAFIIIGITSLVYAFSELLNWLKFLRFKPKPSVSSEVVDAEFID